MLDIIENYYDYLDYRPLVLGASGAELLVRDVSPHIGIYIYVFIGFIGLNLLLPVLYSAVNNRVYSTFSPKYKNELSGYLTCIVHHGVIAPAGAYFIWRDYGVYLEGGEVSAEQYAQVARLAVITVAYLCGDILFSAIPEMISRGKIDNLYHHLLTLGMFVCVLRQPLTLMRYMPHYYICEVSPLLYSVSWLLRRQGYGDGALKKGVELAFASGFFVLRIINMNIVNVLVVKNYYGDLGVVGSGILAVMSLLQVFWFGKIVEIAMGGVGAKPKRE